MTRRENPVTHLFLTMNVISPESNQYFLTGSDQDPAFEI